MIKQRTSALRNNNKGFSLVEMVIAMVIILIGLLGLVQATLLSIDSNVSNVFRDEAVRLAEERMDRLKSLPVTDESLPPAVNQCDATPVKRNVRNLTESYQVCTTIVNLNNDKTRKSVQVVVGWDHKKENPPKTLTGKEFEYSMTSIVVNPT
jgi:type IV pilus assembly protein PilV